MTQVDFGPFVLGGNTFGWTSDTEESFAVLDAFVAAGGRMIDTADVYSAWVPGNEGGESETIIGQWLASRGNRDAVLIETKVFQYAKRPGLSAQNIRAAIDDSLRRLHTDYVDVYYAHRDDPDVPQEEYLAAFDELVRAGKVREFGVSEFEPKRIESAAAIIAENSLTPITVSQDHFSLLHRDPAGEKFALLEKLGIVEVPFWVLENGFLTGKYRPGATVASKRAESVKQLLADPANVSLLARLDAVAIEHRVSVPAVVLAWTRAQGPVAAPIASARIPSQLDALFESADLGLTPEELAFIAGESR